MWSFGVPNVPCGVESLLWRDVLTILVSFLMYRVELKALLAICQVLLEAVLKIQTHWHTRVLKLKS